MPAPWIVLMGVKGANFSNSALLIIIGFSFCQFSPLLLQFTWSAASVIQKFLLGRVHYFRHVQENLKLLLALLVCSFTCANVCGGTFLGEFYRSLVFENKMFSICACRSLQQFSASFIFEKDTFSSVDIVNSDKFGKKILFKFFYFFPSLFGN